MVIGHWLLSCKLVSKITLIGRGFTRIWRIEYVRLDADYEYINKENMEEKILQKKSINQQIFKLYKSASSALIRV